MNSSTIISVEKLSKSFGQGDEQQVLFRELTFQVTRGSFTAIVGKSGSGKSTLLHMLAGLESAESGKIIVDGQDILRASSEELAAFRLRQVGLVFQFFNLLPTLSLQENVALPGYLIGMSRKEADSAAKALLMEVGLENRLRRFPHEVSGGEIQRAAIARALINKPSLILADEPSGNLDPANGERVFELFLQLSKQHRVTLIVVTHDESLERKADAVIRLAQEASV